MTATCCSAADGLSASSGFWVQLRQPRRGFSSEVWVEIGLRQRRWRSDFSPRALPHESERAVNATQSEIRMVIDQDLLEKLDRIRDLLVHRLKGRSYQELLDQMAEIVLRKVDPTKKTAWEEREERSQRDGTSPAKVNIRAKQETSLADSELTRDTSLAKSGCESAEPASPAKPGPKETLATSPAKSRSQSQATELLDFNPLAMLAFDGSPLPEVPPEFDIPESRYIPAKTRRATFRRDGACTYKDPQTGKVCGATYGLQLEHIKPFAHGGSHDSSNLRVLCRQHNALMARRQGL